MRNTISLLILCFAVPAWAQTSSKAGRVELMPLGFATVTDKFVVHAGAGFAVAYHFNDLLGAEVFSSIPGAMTARYTDIVVDLYDYESLTPESVDLKQIDLVAGAAAQISPLWGESDVYGARLGYHLYVVAGVGLVRTLEICAPGRGECSEDVGIGVGLQRPDDAADTNRLAGHLGLGLRLAFSDLVGVRFEVRDVMFDDSHLGLDGVLTEDFKHNIMLMVGLSLLL